MGGPDEHEGLSPTDRSYSRILISLNTTETGPEDSTVEQTLLLDRLISCAWRDSSRLKTRILDLSLTIRSVGHDLVRISATKQARPG